VDRSSVRIPSRRQEAAHNTHAHTSNPTKPKSTRVDPARRGRAGVYAASRAARAASTPHRVDSPPPFLDSDSRACLARACPLLSPRKKAPRLDIVGRGGLSQRLAWRALWARWAQSELPLLKARPECRF